MSTPFSLPDLSPPVESRHSRRKADREAYNDCQRAAHAARCDADDALAAGRPERAERLREEANRWQKRADCYWVILTGTDPAES